MKTIIIDGVKYNLTPAVKEETFNDWRVPTIQELLTLVNYDKISQNYYLKDTKGYSYWSIYTYRNHHLGAWFVNFYDGSVSNDHKDSNYFVRCVRDGEDGLEWSSTSQNKMNWDEAIEYAKNLVAPVYYKG